MSAGPVAVGAVATTQGFPALALIGVLGLTLDRKFSVENFVKNLSLYCN